MPKIWGYVMFLFCHWLSLTLLDHTFFYSSPPLSTLPTLASTVFFVSSKPTPPSRVFTFADFMLLHPGDKWLSLPLPVVSPQWSVVSESFLEQVIGYKSKWFLPQHPYITVSFVPYHLSISSVSSLYLTVDGQPYPKNISSIKVEKFQSVLCCMLSTWNRVWHIVCTQ